MKHKPEELSLAPVGQRARRFEEIAAQVRKLISSGRVKAGDRLPTERELAETFGVARNTMREALRSLEIAGMLELKKGANGGPVVLEGTTNAVVNGMRDLYFLGAISPESLTEARIAVSESVVKLACLRITPEQIETLQLNAEAAEAARKRGEFKERQRLNQEFHVLLARTTGNQILVATMEGIMEVMRQFVEVIGPYEGPTHPTRVRLLRHLADRNKEGAVEEMTASLKRLHNAYMSRARELGLGG